MKKAKKAYAYAVRGVEVDPLSSEKDLLEILAALSKLDAPPRAVLLRGLAVRTAFPAARSPGQAQVVAVFPQKDNTFAKVEGEWDEFVPREGREVPFSGKILDEPIEVPCPALSDIVLPPFVDEFTFWLELALEHEGKTARASWTSTVYFRKEPKVRPWTLRVQLLPFPGAPPPYRILETGLEPVLPASRKEVLAAIAQLDGSEIVNPKALLEAKWDPGFVRALCIRHERTPTTRITQSAGRGDKIERKALEGIAADELMIGLLVGLGDLHAGEDAGALRAQDRASRPAPITLAEAERRLELNSEPARELVAVGAMLKKRIFERLIRGPLVSAMARAPDLLPGPLAGARIMVLAERPQTQDPDEEVFVRDRDDEGAGWFAAAGEVDYA